MYRVLFAMGVFLSVIRLSCPALPCPALPLRSFPDHTVSSELAGLLVAGIHPTCGAEPSTSGSLPW